MQFLFSRSPQTVVVGTLGVVADPGLTSVYAIGRAPTQRCSLGC